VTTTGQPCTTELRTEAVLDATTVNGIDFLEVLPGQTKLAVHFLHPLPGGTGGVPGDGIRLNRTHLRVEGGDRVRGIRVATTSTSGAVITVTVSVPGDFSTYRLRLVDPATGRTPRGFDPALAEIEFSFKAGCPSRFDCRRPEAAPPPVPGPLVRDYLAKDFDSFRQLMLDRLAAALPQWRERNPADLQVALVELLAFVADRLSYEQDAVATESYLGTARRRVSVRRHARLLGYRMHEGCAARTFVHLDVPAEITLARGRQFLTGPPDDPDALVFESLHAVTARKEHHEIAIHTWTDAKCRLPRGATRTTLVRAPGVSLAVGDLLLLEEVASETTGRPVDRDRSHRHVVRLTEATPDEDPLDHTPILHVAWSAEDELPFTLPVSTQVSDAGATTRVVCGVARGNLVLVEHGATPAEPVELDGHVDVAGRWRPTLPEGRPTWAVPFDQVTTPDEELPSAAALLDLDPRAALPAVTVQDAEGNDYEPRVDLLASLPEEGHFVAECEEDGTTRLRFGDDTYARRPDPERRHLATCRSGHGTLGNVGAEALTAMLPAEAGVTVTNPLPATGGVDPEPLEQVRTDAPHAFRVQERAVTEADYGTILTERGPGVQRATGRMRWTGSWYTAFVTVDRVGGAEVDPAHRREVAGFLDRYRMAGVDVDVSRPVPVPLEIELQVCASPDRFSTDVERDVLDVLSSGTLPDGRRGLFHPDRLTFGTRVHLSRVYAAVLAVPGVSTVRATKFRRYGGADRGELAAGVLRVHDLEIAQLANDPDVPERGLLTVSVAGGR
jgi:hypothetical protein